MIKASFLFFVLVVIPFCVFEGTRFNSLYQSCVKIHYENEMLLIGTDCNAWERHKFAKKDKPGAYAKKITQLSTETIESYEQQLKNLIVELFDLEVDFIEKEI